MLQKAIYKKRNIVIITGLFLPAHTRSDPKWPERSTVGVTKRMCQAL